MKKIIGALLLLSCLAFFTLLILRIWGVSIISWPTMLRSGITFVLIGALIVFLSLIYFLFLKGSNRKQNLN